MNLQAEREEEQQQELEAQRALREDAKFASGKIAFFQYLAVALFIFLISGFWDLQVRNPDYYRESAEKNSIKSLPVLAPRGKIYDRDGRVIVDNHSSFSLILSRENLNWDHLKPIAAGVNLDYDSLVQRIRRFQGRPKYEPIIIKEELSPGEIAFVESHRDPATFPEMELIRAQRRLYPKDGVAAHVIGYVGEISEAELDSAEFARYHQGDVIGKDGLERQYNDLLMGVDGQRRVVVDNMGRERQVIHDIEATPGKDLTTTLDLDVQVVAELALEGRRGSVVAIDPRSGEILAMVSHPAYDPNMFAGRIRNQAWKDLMSNPDKPMLNRATQSQFAPGSTFKPLIALAGLETGTIDDKFHVSCGGGATFYGHYFKCHQVHGFVELHKGITQSCDVFFYNVGNRLGIDRIAKYAELAGFGHRTGVDLPYEAEGVMPSSAWKMKNFRQKWYAGETISVAIGQGAVAVTPIQLASAVGGIAVGGAWRRPHLLKDAGTVPLRQGDLQLENVAKVIYGMYGVVNEGGTGVRAQLPGLNVCGKTGSAQVISNKLAHSSAKLGRSMKDNAWFVGFAPREAPEIVVAALFEGGEHGKLAAPIVRDVLKAYFDKKARMAPRPRQLAAAPKTLPGLEEPSYEERP